MSHEDVVAPAAPNLARAGGVPVPPLTEFSPPPRKSKAEEEDDASGTRTTSLTVSEALERESKRIAILRQQIDLELATAFWNNAVVTATAAATSSEKSSTPRRSTSVKELDRWTTSEVVPAPSSPGGEAAPPSPLTDIVQPLPPPHTTSGGLMNLGLKEAPDAAAAARLLMRTKLPINPVDHLPVDLPRLSWDVLDPKKIQRVFHCEGQTEAEMAESYGRLCGDRMKILFDFKKQLYQYFDAVDDWYEYAMDVKAMMEQKCPNAYNEIVSIAKGSADLHDMTESMLFMMACEYEASMTFCDRRKFRNSYAVSRSSSRTPGAGGFSGSASSVVSGGAGGFSGSASVVSGRSYTVADGSVGNEEVVDLSQHHLAAVTTGPGGGQAPEPQPQPADLRQRSRSRRVIDSSSTRVHTPPSSGRGKSKELLINRAVERLQEEGGQDEQRITIPAQDSIYRGQYDAQDPHPRLLLDTEELHQTRSFSSTSHSTSSRKPYTSPRHQHQPQLSKNTVKDPEEELFRKLISGPKACTGLVCRAYADENFSLEVVPPMNGVVTFEVEKMEESHSAPETFMSSPTAFSSPRIHHDNSENINYNLASSEQAAPDDTDSVTTAAASGGVTTSKNSRVLTSPSESKTSAGEDGTPVVRELSTSDHELHKNSPLMLMGQGGEVEEEEARSGKVSSPAPQQQESDGELSTRTPAALTTTPSTTADDPATATSSAPQVVFEVQDHYHDVHSTVAGTLMTRPVQKEKPRVRFVNVAANSTLLYYSLDVDAGLETQDSYTGVTTSIDPPDVLYRVENVEKKSEQTKSCTGCGIQTNDETPPLWLNGALDVIVVYPGISARYVHPGLPMYMGVNEWGVSVLWMAVDDGSRNVVGTKTQMDDLLFNTPGGTSTSPSGKMMMPRLSPVREHDYDSDNFISDHYDTWSDHSHAVVLDGGKNGRAGRGAGGAPAALVTTSDFEEDVDPVPAPDPAGGAPVEQFLPPVYSFDGGIPTTVAMREMLSKKSAEEAVLWLQEQRLAVPNSWFVSDKKTRYIVEVAPGQQVFVRDVSQDDFCAHANQFSECPELIARDLMRVQSSPQRLQRCRKAMWDDKLISSDDSVVVMT
ncbi:unnamed protein product [Amoebophrya sp. A120]|nr:unnamed protein product [Amoebophrya sp. A120]|eukprot:GSA120T00024942001.1